jgi:DNA-binding transcriptional LysR family regulator
MINLRHIEVFYAIMRAGSITEAARVLNVTQPAVSAALKQLESRLKMRLFDRTGGRLQATPEAKALLPDVAEIFGRIGAVERLSQGLAGGALGVFSIAATPPLCDGYVAKAVATFVAKRPGVKVNVQSIASAIALDRVINREVDLGVVYEPVVSSAVQVDELSRAAIGCIMPARHALAKRATIRVSDLAPYPVITYLPQALLRPYIDRAVSDRKSSLDISLQTGTSATAIMLAVHGAGIALVETALFSARPIPGFVARPIEPKVELKILLLRPRQEAGSKVLTDFIAHLRSTFP